MVKPLIGINPYYFQYREDHWNATKEHYYRAIYEAGGIPVTLHYPPSAEQVETIVNKIQGLVMAGGPDLSVELYGGQHPELLDEDVIHPQREAFDRAIFLAMRRQRKPILAICLGLQHINVIYGGNLYEDLNTQFPGALDHGEFNGAWQEHPVNLDAASLVAEIMGCDHCPVASTHHQGIRRLGKGLRAVGWAPDGLIEAVEDEQHPETFIAVQWHPELTAERPEQLNLFRWLIRQE